jgi:hypothetical protein
MATKHQAVWLDIPDGLDELQATELGDAYIEYIYQRTTKDNVDKSGKPFPGYSPKYKESLDFKNMGKSSSVNLELSGDMLAELKILQIKGGRLQIGYENGSDENAKADGNIRGTYGKSTPNPSMARDFLGFEGKELEEKERIDRKFIRSDSSIKKQIESVNNLSTSFKLNVLSKLQKVGEIDGRLNLKNKDDEELEYLYIKYLKKGLL